MFKNIFLPFCKFKSVDCIFFNNRNCAVEVTRFCAGITSKHVNDVATVRHFHSTSESLKAEDRKRMMKSLPKPDEGVLGETSLDVDTLIESQQSMFPDETTPTRLFNGIPFKDLPVVDIHVSKNNTIISLNDAAGFTKARRSCGMEGFKNTRKGTNIAAQATAISFAHIILERGYKTVRVKVRGLGPGRMSSIKGLQMGGMDIVSVTDATLVSSNPPRPRKQRRL